MTADPLGYPGPPLTRSGMIVDGEFREGVAADMAGRRPVLAVGSNASLPVLRSKLAGLPSPVEVPITTALVRDIVVGVSAHVSRAGYVPATAVEVPGARTSLVTGWLDAQQLDAVDATEPTYDRVRLSADRFGVDADVYVSKRGYLVDDDGSPRKLVSQASLVSDLLAASVTLRSLAGETPHEFVITMQKAAARAEAAAIFEAEGWVRPATLFHGRAQHGKNRFTEET